MPAGHRQGETDLRNAAREVANTPAPAAFKSGVARRERGNPNGGRHCDLQGWVNAANAPSAVRWRNPTPCVSANAEAVE
ncbi:hypothetical protein BJA01nite_23000 [Bradyrhizobium japonicum]|nr:hypothetical protein BJ6T_59470 [Bradyrhizobium japonicum USDA 6]GEC44658.1 hypothetical protein BJA01nite_23000 [Bradyrhizobium japonicum]